MAAEVERETRARLSEIAAELDRTLTSAEQAKADLRSLLTFRDVDDLAALKRESNKLATAAAALALCSERAAELVRQREQLRATL
jgi:hypothetical protein